MPPDFNARLRTESATVCVWPSLRSDRAAPRMSAGAAARARGSAGDSDAPTGSTAARRSAVDRAEAEMLVERVTGGRKLPAEVLAQIVAKTDGVPLFVEELTKNVLESGLLIE